MNRKHWKQLYRAFRRGDVNTAYTIKHHGIIVSPGHSGAVRVNQWSAARAMLDMLMRKRSEMSLDDRRRFLVAIRAS